MGVHWLWWSCLLLTGLVLAWALRRTLSEDRETHRSAPGLSSAEDSLRLRFAKGEVDEDEYVRRLQILRES